MVVNRTVVDLFAGTGALGLEALSRGAREAIFVEKDRGCVSLIIRNVATLRYEDRAKVRLADAYRWARTFQPADDHPVVVLIDPPYQEYDRRAGDLNQLIGQLVGKLPAESVVVVEGGRVLDERVLENFATWDIRRYSGTQVAIKVLGGAKIEATAGRDEPAGQARVDQDGSESNDDHDG
jgi:16S rRNA (guanine966-N2)-methyltransferase